LEYSIFNLVAIVIYCSNNKTYAKLNYTNKGDDKKNPITKFEAIVEDEFDGLKKTIDTLINTQLNKNTFFHNNVQRLLSNKTVIEKHSTIEYYNKDSYQTQIKKMIDKTHFLYIFGLKMYGKINFAICDFTLLITHIKIHSNNIYTEEKIADIINRNCNEYILHMYFRKKINSYADTPALCQSTVTCIPPYTQPNFAMNGVGILFPPEKD
jgi:hypothetical protein